MEDPDRPWKKAAFSQYPRGKIMGYSMRTDRYRYTQWLPRDGGRPSVGHEYVPPNGLVASELYDHQTDPQENVNLANRPRHKMLIRQLGEQLHAGWRAASPKK